MHQPEGLLSVLNDLSAPIGDRDDAAMDLSAWDDALPGLITISSRDGEDPLIVASCGESIGEIWKRTGGFDRATYLTLPIIAQTEISALLDLK